jgi:hypothetical protein
MSTCRRLTSDLNNQTILQKDYKCFCNPKPSHAYKLGYNLVYRKRSLIQNHVLNFV